MEASEYWRRVCSPLLRQRKAELDRNMPNKEIAAYVESRTGKHSNRALVGHWFTGFREPYISQLIALCDKLGIDYIELLRGRLILCAPALPKRKVIVGGINVSIPSSKIVRSVTHIGKKRRYK